MNVLHPTNIAEDIENDREGDEDDVNDCYGVATRDIRPGESYEKWRLQQEYRIGIQWIGLTVRARECDLCQ